MLDRCRPSLNIQVFTAGHSLGRDYIYKSCKNMLLSNLEHSLVSSRNESSETNSSETGLRPRQIHSVSKKRPSNRTD